MNPAIAVTITALLAVGSSAPAGTPWFSPPTTAVVSHDVTFVDGDAKLHGALYLPERSAKVPAVGVFHGASEPLASTPLYAHLRDGLPQIGIAVLLFDRRGTGASTGKADVPYERWLMTASPALELSALYRKSILPRSAIGESVRADGWPPWPPHAILARRLR
jgi:hypothetical protein